MKRKMMGLLVMLVFVGVMGAMPVMAGKITTSDGYEFTTDAKGFIQIGDAEALSEFAKFINADELSGDNNANAILTADITLRDTSNWTTWNSATQPTDINTIPAWTPIGNMPDAYGGTFDGAGHTISGIYINAPDLYGQGLFGWCTGDPNINNLKITASYIKGNNCTGGIAGLMDGTITNCQVAATVVGLNDVGGVVGQAIQLVTGSSFSGSVTGEERVGGIAGTAYDISNSYNTGSVDGKNTVGGIAGDVEGSISNCYNTGSVKGVNNVVGGIAGSNSGSLANCYNTGKVDGLSNVVGGIAGNNSGSLVNSYNTGNVSAFSSIVGGIVGANSGNLANCSYLTGSAGYGEWGHPSIANGIGNAADAAGQTEAKTAAVFSSWEMAWRLNNYSGFDQANWLRWTQNPGAATPTHSLDGSNIIDKKITLDYEEPSPDLVFYGAVGSSLIGLPTAPAGYIYSYTVGSTTYSQAEMASYQFTAEDGLVFTVKKYQLNFNNEGIIEIDTPEELTEFAKYVNAGNSGANGKLTADITLNETLNNNPTTDWTTWGTSPPEEITPWTPIGNYSGPGLCSYSGTFDGNNHTISGIYINAPTSNSQGLFGWMTESAEIKNMGVVDSYISGGCSTGGVAGYMDGTISNCFNTGTVSGNDIFVGGVAGKICGTISNCYNTGIIISHNDDVGGVAGGVFGTIRNSYNTGSVNGDGDNVGGLAGLAHYIDNCSNTGDVKGTNYVGGVVGFNYSISNCYTTGKVTGTSNVGSVVGYAKNASTNCYYLENSAVYGNTSTPAYGIGDTTADTPGQTEAKPAIAFASGEVTWRLQAGQTDPTMPVWGQQLDAGAEPRPLLKATERVYYLTLMKGDGSLFGQNYHNDTYTTNLGGITGITWKDASGNVYSVIKHDADLTLYPWLTTPPTTVPTATAVYGTKLGDIAFSGASDPAGSWSWKGTATELDQVLAVDHNTACSARYIANADPKGIYDVAITPAITRRSLNAAGVAISLPANSYAYTGAAIEPAVTVSDSVATITAADYTVTYTGNTSPGTATVTITGQGNYQDEVTRNFTIYSSGGGGYTPPSMWGITVTPQTISFDPTGQLAVDITGAPAGAVVYYSLDGSSYSTTPPAITNAGEHQVFIRITCPGYQDYRTQTTVSVAKQVAPAIPAVSVSITGGQPLGTTDLGALLPADRGQTRYQLGPVDDPRGILDGAPTIDPNGLISYGFRSQLANSGEVATAAAANKAAPTATITVQVNMENYEDTTITLVVTGTEPEPPAPVIGIRYLTHIQDSGWETEWVTDGALSGTYGQSKRLEALKVELTGELPAGASIETTVHVQNQGDLGPFAMGSAAGTTGRSLRLENICLTLNNLPGYTLLYNVHVQDRGWLRDENDSSSWFRAGEVAGTSALSLRLEGIKIKLVKTAAGGL